MPYLTQAPIMMFCSCVVLSEFFLNLTLFLTNTRYDISIFVGVVKLIFLSSSYHLLSSHILPSCSSISHSMIHNLPKQIRIQHHFLSHPNRSIRMIPRLLFRLCHFPPFCQGRFRRVGMNQNTQRPPPNRQPPHKRAKLRRSKDIHLEHGNGVGAHGFLPKGVDPKFRELAPDALVQFGCVSGLRGVVREVVDVYVTLRKMSVNLKG